MSPNISERSFEEAIECGLLQGGPDACLGATTTVRETPPPYYSGCKFRLAYFRPASGLNEETRRLHAANLFSIVRQLRYSTRNDNCLDLVLLLNGIPIFTAELKNPLTGQTVEDAIKQYKTTRDPREPLLSYGRCLAHFAVDPELVYVTTRIAGPSTHFLPSTRGSSAERAIHPSRRLERATPPATSGRRHGPGDSVLDLLRQFIHEVEEEISRTTSSSPMPCSRPSPRSSTPRAAIS